MNDASNYNRIKVFRPSKGMQVAFIRKEMLGIYDSERAFMQSGKTCAYLLELSILFKRSGSLGRDGREYFCGQGFIKKSVQKCDADIWDADVYYTLAYFMHL